MQPGYPRESIIQRDNGEQIINIDFGPSWIDSDRLGNFIVILRSGVFNPPMRGSPSFARYLASQNSILQALAEYIGENQRVLAPIDNAPLFVSPPRPKAHPSHICIVHTSGRLQRPTHLDPRCF